MEENKNIILAQTKLQEELKKEEKNYLAKPIGQYLLNKVQQSESLAEDINKEAKTLKQCCDYVTEQARKFLSGKSGGIEDEVVFQWAEDYYHAPTPVVAPKKNTNKKAKTQTKTQAKTTKLPENVKENTKTKARKKQQNSFDGQMDLSMFGIC